jgi:hypothetical protein
MLVYKYPLKYKKINQGFLGQGVSWESEQEIELSMGSELLKVDIQNDQLVCWAVTDPDKPNIVKHTLIIVGTGQEIKTNVKYLSTFYDGGLVMHVFTKKEVHSDYETI